MAEHLVEAILHTLIAAVAVEALLRLWRVEEPGVQLRFRLVVLALPVLGLPAFEWLAPFRHSEWFEDRWALFSGRRWGALSLLGVALDRLWLGAFAAVGALLLLRDLTPFLRARRTASHLEESADGEPRLLAEVAALSARLGLRPPSVRLLDSGAVSLYCRGVRRPALIASRGVLRRLDDRELSAALAHELGHLSHRDVLLGWVLIAARAVHAFNPGVQVVSRAIARDAERRADETGARACGDRLALASGLIKLFLASRGGVPEGAPAWRTVVTEAHEAVIEARCRRLLNPVEQPTPESRGLLAMTAVALGGLLFFVT